MRTIIRDWLDWVREGLEKVRPPQEAHRLANAYGAAFSREYRASVDPDDAVRDILQLESMWSESRDESVLLANPDKPANGSSNGASNGEVSHLMLYRRGRGMILSDFLPILENAGLRVIGMSPFEVGAIDDVTPATVYRFHVQDADGNQLDPEASGTLLSKTILAVSRGDAANDALNALTIQAGLAWRQVDVLRCYATYAFQLQAVPSRQTIPAALRRNPAIASLLFRHFRTAFDPDGPDLAERKREIKKAQGRIPGGPGCGRVAGR